MDFKDWASSWLTQRKACHLTRQFTLATSDLAGRDRRTLSSGCQSNKLSQKIHMVISPWTLEVREKAQNWTMLTFIVSLYILHFIYYGGGETYAWPTRRNQKQLWKVGSFLPQWFLGDQTSVIRLT